MYGPNPRRGSFLYRFTLLQYRPVTQLLQCRGVSCILVQIVMRWEMRLRQYDREISIAERLPECTLLREWSCVV